MLGIKIFKSVSYELGLLTSQKEQMPPAFFAIISKLDLASL
jgi:hypothetical protein